MAAIATLRSQVDCSSTGGRAGASDERPRGALVSSKLLASVVKPLGRVREPQAGERLPCVTKLLFTAEGALRGSWVDFTSVGLLRERGILPPDLSMGPVLVRLSNLHDESSCSQIKNLADSGALASVWLDLNTSGNPDDETHTDQHPPSAATLAAIRALAPFVTEVRRCRSREELIRVLFPGFLPALQVVSAQSFQGFYQTDCVTPSEAGTKAVLAAAAPTPPDTVPALFWLVRSLGWMTFGETVLLVAMAGRRGARCLDAQMLLQGGQMPLSRPIGR